MSHSDHTTLGKPLADARTTHEQINSAPYLAIASLAEAYKVQTAATDSYPSAQIGYKVGATNPDAQKLFGCDEPFYGPLFDADRLAPGANLSLAKGIGGGEAEFAFLCGHDFPTDQDLNTNDLAELIESCHIAVEIVGSRITNVSPPCLHAVVADFGGNAGFIEGPAIDNWNTIDLTQIQVTATTNGTETNSGTAAIVLGHPLNSLLWMHNALRANGHGLKAGDWVSTGTCLGLIAAAAGSVEVEFKGHGTIAYQLS